MPVLSDRRAPGLLLTSRGTGLADKSPPPPAMASLRRTAGWSPERGAGRGIRLVGVTERDDLLVARIAAGDDYALGELIERFGSLLLGIGRRICGSQALAEDVLQEVISELWRHPDRYRPERGSLRAYLGIQAQRRAVDACRSETRRKARQGRWDLLVWPSGHATDDGADRSDLKEVVGRAIARLPGEQRQAVELAFWAGQTHKEIAQSLRLPEGTVKSRLRLAQAKLAEWLAPVGAELR